MNTIWVLNGLNPDQDRRSVGPDLCPNCLQKLSADEKGRQETEIQLQSDQVHCLFNSVGSVSSCQSTLGLMHHYVQFFLYYQTGY